jgi:hypothetical protein
MNLSANQYALTKPRENPEIWQRILFTIFNFFKSYQDQVGKNPLLEQILQIHNTDTPIYVFPSALSLNIL